jgi:hypothetical protein
LPHSNYNISHGGWANEVRRRKKIEKRANPELKHNKEKEETRRYS